MTSPLDPEDWKSFRTAAHRMLDDALEKMQSASQGRVWTPFPEEMKEALKTAVPRAGIGTNEVGKKLAELLPFGVGNTHPRFFGWVHGSGSPGCILAAMTEAAMNANLGGRDHGPVYVEKQVIEWCRQLMGFPESASGLIVSGTSMATIIALKIARDQAVGKNARTVGIIPGLTGYASEQAHSCIGRAFDLLGLGTDSLRKIPCDQSFRMDLGALKKTICMDREKGLTPFVIIGSAGSVNVGAIDPLDTLADLAATENLWYHVDGAFGATAALCPELKPKLKGMERADSLGFDFHKWLHVNYDAGCVLVRSRDKHLGSFCGRPEYLGDNERGLAAGAPWPVDFGPELSRGFRALKVWSHLLEHGTDRLGRAIVRNCEQARYLQRRIEEKDTLELLAPVHLNIVCFRCLSEKECDLNRLNSEIVTTLQMSGIAAPSTTVLNGRLAIRVNLTNHRTEFSDLDLLLSEVEKAARVFERTPG